MRLLSKVQVEDQKKKQHAAEASKGLRIAELVDKNRKALNDIKTKKQQELEELENECNLKKKTLSEELLALNNEVTSRRAERIELMKPIKDVQARANDALAQAEKKQAELDEREKKVLEREQDYAQKVELLQNRTDYLDEWEGRLTDQERLQTLQAKTFRQSTVQVFKGIEKEKSLLSLKAQELADKESELSQREGAIQIVLESIGRQKDALDKQKVKLQDERQTLDRAWNELKQKHG